MMQFSTCFFRFYDWLLPNLCLVCGRPSEQVVCAACSAALGEIPHHCRRCFRELPAGEEVCGKCLQNPPFLDAIEACYPYNEGTREIILPAKFMARRAGLFWMGSQMADVLGKRFPMSTLCAMPISKRRLWQRGFNQTQLLVERIAKTAARPWDSYLVKTHRAPQSLQTSYQLRRKNIKGAFSLGKMPAEAVLIIDDVATSGATLNEAARILKLGGAKWVGALVFAATVKTA